MHFCREILYLFVLNGIKNYYVCAIYVVSVKSVQFLREN